MNPACPHRQTLEEHDTMGLVHVLTEKGRLRCQTKDRPLDLGDRLIELDNKETVMPEDEQIYEATSAVEELRQEIDGQLEIPFEEALEVKPVDEPTPVPVRSFVATYSMTGSVKIEGVNLVEAAQSLAFNNPGMDIHSVYEVVHEEVIVDESQS